MYVLCITQYHYMTLLLITLNIFFLVTKVAGGLSARTIQSRLGAVGQRRDPPFDYL